MFNSQNFSFGSSPSVKLARNWAVFLGGLENCWLQFTTAVIPERSSLLQESAARQLSPSVIGSSLVAV